MTRAGALLVAVLAPSCASYGWADRPTADSVAQAVTVRTVDVDAHAGVDAAALTRALVDELRRAGLVGAQWSGAAVPAGVVECDIVLVEDSAFSEHAFVTVSTRCRVDGAEVSARRGDARVSLSADARQSGRGAAAETAARASLPDVAHDLADHFRGGS